MSKHKFKLVKIFEYDDFKNDTNSREFSLDIMSLVVFGNGSIVSHIVNDNNDILNKWLLEHGALVGEIVHIHTHKSK
jgi:hypothetical protein